MKLTYIAVVGIPNPENINTLKVIQGTHPRENPQNQLSTISNKIVERVQSLADHHAIAYFKPRDSALNRSNFRQVLQAKTLDELADEFGAENEICDVFGDDESPDAPLIICFMRSSIHELRYFAFAGTPTSQNIDTIQMFNGIIPRIHTNDQLSTLVKVITQRHRALADHPIASFYKSRDVTLDDEQNARRMLKEQTLERVAKEVSAEDSVYAVFGDSDVPSPQTPLIVCFAGRILHYLAFADFPTKENIRDIQIFSGKISVRTSEELSTLTERLLEQHPTLHSSQARFFKPQSKPDESSIRRMLEQRDIAQAIQELSPRDFIYEAFGVEADEPLPRRTLLVCFHGVRVEAVHPPSDNTGEADDIIGEMEKEFSKYTRAVAQGQTPSVAAKSTNYQKNQDNSSTVLLDGRFTESGDMTTALPVELYHPTFATFLSHASDRNAKISVDFLRKTAELMRNLSLIVGSEHKRDDTCRTLLADILDTPISTIVNIGKSSSDFASLQTTPFNVSAASYLGEIKTEIGTGGSDPSVQVSFSYARYYCQPNRAAIRDICCCPALILALAGPWISVLGAVMTSRTVVQRLSGYQWFACSRILDDEQVINLARILHALRLGIAELKEYYSKLKKPDEIRGNYIAPRFCPSITSYVNTSNATINFRYVKPLEREHTCVTFLAEILNGDLEGQHVVIKFVRNYGVEAHRWMASQGFAPELIHHGSLGTKYRGLALVLMEYARGSTLHQRYDSTGLPQEVRDAVRTGLDKLAEKNFVFGDLRTPNIMLADANEDVLMVKRLRFIDFDWACLDEGEDDTRARYPFHLSSAIRDLAGAEDYEIIQRRHQEAMFANLH